MLASFNKYIRRDYMFFKLANDYDLVINCTGLRAANLVEDRHIRPQRGVLLQINAPWIKHFVYIGSDETFICPG